MPQNPGIGGLQEFTSSEKIFLQNLTGLSYSAGDLLYYDGSNLNRLPVGSPGQFLGVSTGIPTWDTPAGSGDVTGAASSTDNAIVRFDGLTGKIIQDYTSGAPTISDTGAVNIPLTTGNSLVVDTSTFVVDATNNRVGILTASPGQTFAVNLGLEQVWGVDVDGVATFPHALGTGFSYIRAPSNRGVRFQSGTTTLVDFPATLSSAINLNYARLQIGDSSAAGNSIYFNSIGASDLNIRAGDGNVARTADVIISVKDNQEVARFTDTLRLGIGTTTPQAMLTVGGTQSGNAGLEVVPGSGIVLQAYNRTSSAYSSISFDGSSMAFRSSGTSGTLHTFRQLTTTLAGTTVGAAFDYSTSVTNAASNMTGIALTTAAVTAASTNTLRGLTITPGAITNATGTSTYIGALITMPAITQSAGTLTSTGLRINGGTVTSGTAYALITDSTAGNVGIGTTTPGAKLHISDTTNPGIILEDTNASADQKIFSMYTDTGSFYIRRMTDSLSGYTPAITINSSSNVGIGTTSPSALLTLGTAGTTSGTLSLAGGTSGVITLQTAAAAGTYTLTLPTSDGNANEVLTTNGSGVLSWTVPAGTGANTALSNLASVAINTTLVSDTDNTYDLGTSSVFWRTGYFKTSIELGATDTTITRSAAGVIAVEGVPVVNTTTAQTVTNKRNQPRTASSTSNANLDPDLATANVYFRTTQTTGLTIGAPTGTPVIGETIAIYVDSAGAQTLTMNAAYIPFGAAFPATTTAGKTLMIVAQFNGTDWKTTWSNAF